MIAPLRKVRSRRSVPAWHAGFMALLPRIYACARFAFRGMRDPEAKQEALQSVVAGALAAYVRLVQLGKADIAYAGPLAKFAIRQYHDGRMLGRSLNCKDVTSDYCRRATGVVIERLDQFDEEEECWSQAIVEDRAAGPAETARVRLDFAAWLDSLKRRDRKIALKLAEGETTSDVASRFKISAGRISQLRKELKAAWDEFTGDEPDENAAAVAA